MSCTTTHAHRMPPVATPDRVARKVNRCTDFRCRFRDGGRAIPESEYLIEDEAVLTAGKMRYISGKLNGLEDFTADKTQSAKETLEARYSLSTRAEAARTMAVEKLKIVDDRFKVTDRVNDTRERAMGKVEDVQTTVGPLGQLLCMLLNHA